MAVDIYTPPPSRGIFGSKALGLGLGALSGGAGMGLLGGSGAMGALGGAGVSLASQSSPAIGRALSVYETGKGASDLFSKKAETPYADSHFTQPQLGDSAISRRMSLFSSPPTFGPPRRF